MLARRIFVRRVVIGAPGETTRAAAERMENAYVLEFLSAERGAGGRLLERGRT